MEEHSVVPRRAWREGNSCPHWHSEPFPDMILWVQKKETRAVLPATRYSCQPP